MPQLRGEFRGRLAHLGDLQVTIAEELATMLERAVEAVATADRSVHAALRAADDTIDAHVLEVRESALRLLALEAPVSAELRLVVAMLHANLHLARMGDLAVAVARRAGRDDSRSDELGVSQLTEMGRTAARMAPKAVLALVRRDEQAARSLPDDDQPVDELNAALRRRATVTEGAQPGVGLSLVLSARSIERFADHAVAIAEEAVYAATGTWGPLEASDEDWTVP